jgi:hypothetical protein
LIIPGLLLVLLAIWGVFETGRKFRTEFKKRGKSWDSVSASMQKGDGLLVVDMIWGPQKGLGHPVIWWLPSPLAPGEELAPRVETGDALLVRCPRALKNVDALRQRFGQQNVVVHSWAVAREVLEAGTAASQR